MYEYDRYLSAFPPLMRLADGTPVRTAEQFAQKREEIINGAFFTEYGGMPPAPEVCTWLQTQSDSQACRWTVTYGTEKITRSFDLTLCLPRDFSQEKKYPVLLSGDDCWHDRFWQTETVETFLSRGFLVALFDRTKLAPDDAATARSVGLYEIYPDGKFCTVSAWAYGYHRAVDVLLSLPYVDPSMIGITGHSRGGKAVLVAGATDERIPFVNPNGSGTHGCASWHYETHDPDAPGDDKRSEPLSFMCDVIPFWLGEGIRSYVGREAEIPYDMHWFKALIAPRYLLETEGFDDLWANPHGSYLTTLAAEEAFAFCGVPDHNLIHFREGGHFHQAEDRLLLISLMESVRDGKPQPKELRKKYFPGLAARVGMEE